MLWMLFPLALIAKPHRGEGLARMLGDVLSIEQVHPDSVCPYIERIEAASHGIANREEQLLYLMALGRLYSERQRLAHYSGRTDYADCSYQCFVSVLNEMELLSSMRAMDWLPSTAIGRDGRYFHDDMLNVAWRLMLDNTAQSVRDTSSALPALADVILFYQQKGNDEAAMLLRMDSILASKTLAKQREEALLALCDQYAGIPLCAEVYLQLSQCDGLTVQQRVAYLNRGLQLYPKYRRREALRNQLLTLSDPYLDVDVPSQAYPGKEVYLRFKARNVASVMVGGTEHRFDALSPYDEIGDSVLWIAPNEPGESVLTFLPNISVKSVKKPKAIVKTVFVTRLKMLCQPLPDEKVRIIVVDSESGKPQSGVSLSLYEQDSDSTSYASYLTDKMGCSIVPCGKRRSLYVRMSTDSERHHPIMRLRCVSSWRGEVADSVCRVRLFSNRAVYRPLQSASICGVAYIQNGWDAVVAAERAFTLVLRDASRKEVERKDVISDEMGVFVADFTLPADGRLGKWSVTADGGGAVSFEVQEYKRPTFTVTLADTACLSQDKIAIHGTATRYDGTPMSGTRITGKWLCSPWLVPHGAETTLLDTIRTDKDGRFTCLLPRDKEALSLQVQVDALSNYGEQQSACHWYRIPGGVADDRVVPADSSFVVTCDKDTFNVDSPATVGLRSNLPDLYIFYTLSAAGTVVKDTILRLNCDSLRLVIPYDNGYDTGAVASFCFVKGGKVVSRTQNLYLRQPDTRLRVRWDTFRDKVLPGSVQEWRLTLLRPDGEPVHANMMVTLYDASLDHLARNSWSLGVVRPYRLYSIPYSQAVGYRDGTASHHSYPQKRFRVDELSFSSLNDELFGRRSVYGVTTTSFRITRAVDNVAYDADEPAPEMVAEEQHDMGEQPSSLPPLREDFSEEAIFMPSLRTNERGEIGIVFALPESLTTWRLLGVAHTADMMTACVDEEIVATKDMTAQLRMPRFMRAGDEGQIIATVTNNTGIAQTGVATLQIFDARSEELLSTFTAMINLVANGDTACHFPCRVQDGDLIVRWSVESSGGSDGERRLLAVIPSMTEVTSTVAFSVSNPCSKSIDISHLYPCDATDRWLTVEYTTHPEQYALQALPPLCKAKRNDVLSLATAYYAGMLAKSLHLSVTDSTAYYLERIMELQKPDGSFTWYPGMPGSAYLTREVGYLLARLRKLTYNSGDKDTYQKAARYLLTEMPVPQRVTTDYLRNLYVIQSADLRLTRAERQKTDSLVALVRNLRPEQIDAEGQALCALVLAQDGETKKAKAMVDAFRRRLVATEDAGTYMEFPQGPWSSIDRKLDIHVQHIEAMQAVLPEAEELAGMRRHLLYEKRTQAWETPVTSANAVFALMYGQSSPEPQTARDLLTLHYGKDEVLNFIASADSLGYVRVSLEVVDTVKELHLQKFSEGESWGSVYADYRQAFDKVADSSMGLSISCEYPGKMQAGQRITAIYNVVADRDYDYVTLTMPHPAAMEAAEQFSGYGSHDGLGYYREARDDFSEYHFYHIPHGHYQITEDFYIERGGLYHTGVPTVRCEYAPEFSGHSSDTVLTIIVPEDEPAT